MQLLVATIARPPNARHLAKIGDLVASVDWGKFVELVDHHRVAPLAYDGLASVCARVPGDAATRLRTWAVADRTASLRLSGVLNELTGHLAAAGIKAISVKGPTLGVLAFGDMSVRQSKDLDILITPHVVPQALVVLKQLGCRQIVPAGLNDASTARLLRRPTKDLTLLHEPSGVQIELHWRLNTNPHLLPLVIAQSRQTLAVGNCSQQTLAADDLLLYLCVHGAKHFWWRLKWLADVWALLGLRDPDELTVFYERAAAFRLEVPAGQMLLLLQAVFGLSLPPDLWTRIDADPRTRVLSRSALRYIGMANEIEAGRFEATLMGLQTLMLRRSVRYVLYQCYELLVEWPTVLRRIVRWVQPSSPHAADP